MENGSTYLRQFLMIEDELGKKIQEGARSHGVGL